MRHPPLPPPLPTVLQDPALARGVDPNKKRPTSLAHSWWGGDEWPGALDTDTERIWFWQGPGSF